MIVMGLDIEDLEYGYRIDGPYEPEKGHIFDKTKVLLDPYAKAVAGQREWGQQKIGSYHARVVRDSFDWEDMPQSTRKISDLIIYELHVRGFTQDASSGVTHPEPLPVFVKRSLISKNWESTPWSLCRSSSSTRT